MHCYNSKFWTFFALSEPLAKLEQEPLFKQMYPVPFSAQGLSFEPIPYQSFLSSIQQSTVLLLELRPRSFTHFAFFKNSSKF